MKYLKFITKKKINPVFSNIIDFEFVISNSSEGLANYNNKDIKVIRIGMHGREVAHLKSEIKNFRLEPTFFTIARNFLIKKISNNEAILDNEELQLDAEKYLFNDYESFFSFNTETIEIQ